MQGFDVEELKKVNSARDANQLLQNGWKLLTVIATNTTGGSFVPTYIMGRPNMGAISAAAKAAQGKVIEPQSE